ncbi:hypothetical protein [uncultured Capnocytophaga sp.]|nr:hypothetical protein [uncultured Capnocytophaga sp.]
MLAIVWAFAFWIYLFSQIYRCSNGDDHCFDVLRGMLPYSKVLVALS